MTEKIKQQVISDVERTLDRTDTMMDGCWNMWQICMNSLYTSGLHLEQMARDYTEQHNRVVAEGSKTMAQIVQNIQDTQKHMMEMIRDGGNSDYWKTEQAGNPMANYWAEINRKYQNYLQNLNKVA